LATSLDTLVKRTRRFLRDYPVPADALTISLSSNATSLTMSDTTLLRANWTVEIDYETILIRTLSSSTVATCLRGWQDSTAVSHANSSAILIHPAFSATEIIDALNAAKDEMYPYVYKPILDTSLTADGATYEFTIPSTIRHLAEVEIQQTNTTGYLPIRPWSPRRAATPKLQFRRAPVAGTLRLHGFGTFDDLTASADTIDALFPPNAERALVIGAASRLLSSGEAGRVRQDTGARDDREAANRPGAAISLANQLERRFEKDLARAAMPPMTHHVQSVY
jgi:hypothetical protein